MYVFFFISLVLYNIILVAYAVSIRISFIIILFSFFQLKVQNIVEVYSFMVINTLIMIYGSFQVYQFRGFGVECDAITHVGYLALANVRTLYH